MVRPREYGTHKEYSRHESTERSESVCAVSSQRNPAYPPIQSNHQSSEAHHRLCQIGGGADRLQSAERRDYIGESAPFCGGEYRISVGDYRDIEILPDSVIYCDIPYKGTEKYCNDTFDHDAFYEWALRQEQPLFISEYDMPDDFVAVAQWERTSTFSATNNSLKRVEKIFRPRRQLKNDT